jgi:succinate dehydrogenase / fumarate reductase, iron-sulfur subunit
MKFRIFRYNPDDTGPHYDLFEVPQGPGMTVLAALTTIQEQQDPGLSFRSSCRGAVCGACAMLINKVPRLACRTQVKDLVNEPEKFHLSPYPALAVTTPWDPASEVLIEPLPHLPLLKDLVVDMTLFFDFLHNIDPVLHPKVPVPGKEYLMEPDAVRKLEQFTNCVLCGACFGSCPVNSRNPDYPGPAALAALYRFSIDPRERDPGLRIATADTGSGWWACEFHANCAKVCPKGVPPNIAIGLARKELKRIKGPHDLHDPADDSQME